MSKTILCSKKIFWVESCILVFFKFDFIFFFLKKARFYRIFSEKDILGEFQSVFRNLSPCRVSKPPPPGGTFFSWWLVAMWLATGGWVAERWLVASHRSPVTSHQEFSHQVTSHQNGWWLVAGGWWLVASLL